MFRHLVACIALAAPIAVAQAQVESSPAQAPGEWVLEIAPNGCLVHAATPTGTTVSVWGRAGEDSLRFLVQNPTWNSLQDGGKYDLQVGFDGKSQFPLEAVARQNLDQDGPGLTFAVSPAAEKEGVNFLDSFAAADGMHISQDGKRLETMALKDNRTAMGALAKCLSMVYQSMANAAAAQTPDGGEAAVVEVSADATPL